MNTAPRSRIRKLRILGFSKFYIQCLPIHACVSVSRSAVHWLFTVCSFNCLHILQVFLYFVDRSVSQLVTSIGRRQRKEFGTKSLIQNQNQSNTKLPSLITNEGSFRARSSGGTYLWVLYSCENGDRWGGRTTSIKYFSTGNSFLAFTESYTHCGCT